MKTLHRRLDSLQRIVDRLSPPPQLQALALEAGAGDLALVDGEWLPCSDTTAVLELHDGPFKVYTGFDPREMLTCPPRD
jgi:hypothetical protein